MKHDSFQGEYEKKQQQLLKEIDNALFSYIDEYAVISEDYSVVKEAMLYSAMAGGKRVRPVLALMFCEACGKPFELAMPFACAIEMIHCYSLIHDDLPCMDDDDFRRGKPSCHKKFGEANALLAGDALLTLAFEIIADAPQKSGVSSASALKAVKALSSYAGMGGMIGGQVMDLTNEGKDVNGETLAKTDIKKTSALITVAVLLGIYAGGKLDEESNQELEFAKEYAKELGLAFQIVDDILDVIGDEKTLGKPIGSDSQNQKTTYVSFYSLEAAKELAREHTKKAVDALGNTFNSEFLFKLTDIMLNRTM